MLALNNSIVVSFFQNQPRFLGTYRAQYLMRVPHVRRGVENFRGPVRNDYRTQVERHERGTAQEKVEQSVQQFSVLRVLVRVPRCVLGQSKVWKQLYAERGILLLVIKSTDIRRNAES